MAAADCLGRGPSCNVEASNIVVVLFTEISLAYNQKSEAATTSGTVNIVVVMMTTVRNGALQARNGLR